MNKKSKELELKKRLREVEEILDALRNHKVDAVVGTDQITMLRLKEVEDQLHEQIKISDSRLREIETIYQNVPVGLSILDQDLRFRRVNEHLAKIHGIPVEEHLGRKMSKVLPKLAGNTEPELREVIETGKPKMNVELHGEIPNQPGDEKFLLQHWLPLHNSDGVVTGINMVVQEITERKKFEDELQQQVAERTKIAEHRAEKLREMALEMTHVEEKERQRLARVLHDGLQQLLIGAKFNTKLIRNKIPDDEAIKKQLDELKEILDQSIESSRSLSYELSPPILHDHGLLAGLRWLADMRHMKGLNIDVKTGNDIPELSQDLKVFLFQIVRELLINVIKHAGTNYAQVRLASDEQFIRIEVIDNGKGFNPSKKELTSTNSQGLRNIQKKLELMNGDFIIDSNPGEGSHFTVVVPLDGLTAFTEIQHPEKDPQFNPDTKNFDLSSAGDGHNKIKVLVVDDHQVMRKGLVKLLTSESNIQIIGEASNGLEAVNFVQNNQPDVVIMDITMPQMDGIEATQRITRNFPNVRIVGLSMHDEKEYISQMKKAGATNLLNKGGPPEQLLKAIQI